MAENVIYYSKKVGEPKIIEVGLCGPGRHEINNANGEKILQFLFPAIVENPLDFDAHNQIATQFIEGVCKHEPAEVHLYCTGLTPCLTSFLHTWVNTFLTSHRVNRNDTPVLYLFHHNRDTNQFDQQLFTSYALTQGLA